MEMASFGAGLVLGIKKGGGSAVKKEPWEYPAEWLPLKDAGDKQMTFLISVGAVGKYVTITHYFYAYQEVSSNTNTAVSIDWGDGNTDSLAWSDFTSREIQTKHTYTEVGQFWVTVQYYDLQLYDSNGNESNLYQPGFYQLTSSNTPMCLACVIGDNCRFSEVETLNGLNGIYCKVKLTDLKWETGLNSNYNDYKPNTYSGFQRNVFNLFKQSQWQSTWQRIDFSGDPQGIDIKSVNLAMVTGIDNICDIPDGVSGYTSNQIWYSPLIRTLTLNKLQTLKSSAIMQMSGLVTLKMPSCTKIMAGAIVNCPMLRDIYVAEGCEIADGALPTDHGVINVHYI